jgi:hypothetical protein
MRKCIEEKSTSGRVSKRALVGEKEQTRKGGKWPLSSTLKRK